MWHPDMPEEYKNQIVTGDARDLAKWIPDESIDLIFTDPIYDRIEDYEWLAIEAKRLLKENSALLTFCGIGFLPETINSLISGGLIYRWQIALIVYGSYRPGPGNIANKWAAGLWFDKNGNSKSKMRGIWDMRMYKTGVSKLPGWINHKLSKHVDFIAEWTNAFTNKNDMVFDPFVGGGTVPGVCKMLGRNYIAFEIEPETAKKANEFVDNIQPPLFVLEHEQLELSVASNDET